ncbi:MAG TPA: YciI family protein [Acidimicrobiia bacterium]|jgi:hypothetical protein
MRYLLLIYGPPFDPSSVTEADQAASMGEWAEFTASLRRQGAMEAGEALTGPETATTIRVRAGQTLTTDGPFAETAEVLGGYYVLNVRDLDQAIAIAAACPAVRGGSIELRPILDFGEEYDRAVAERVKAGQA